MGQTEEESKAQIKAKNMTYYETHREERLAYQKAYRDSHLEETRLYRRIYYNEHKEEIKARVRAYRAANLNVYSASEKAYRKSHKEEIRSWFELHRTERNEYRCRRYAMIKAGTWATRNHIQSLFEIMAACNGVAYEDYTDDQRFAAMSLFEIMEHGS